MSQFAWTFPGGKQTITKDTAVAGNVGTTKTVPAGKIWQLTSVSIILTTDATVVNRYPSMIQRDIADVAKIQITASLIAQSTTVGKYWVLGISAVSATVNALGAGLLFAGEDLVLQINSGVAGDAYDYLVEYLEIDAP